MANTPKALTEKELQEIETLAGLGLRYEDIARLKGMCDDTLKKYAKERLECGKAKAKATIMQTAYKLAASGKVPAMTMFWLKTQCGWRESLTGEVECQNLMDKVEGSGKPTQAVVMYLAETMEQVKRGELDPKVATSIASVAGAFMKAVAQGSLEERLVMLEAVMKSPASEPMDLDL